MRVEEVSYEGEVELRVAGDEGGGGEEFAAAKGVCVLEYLLGTLEEISLLEGSAGAGFWG